MVRNWDSGIRPTLKLNTSELMYDAEFHSFHSKL